MIKVLKNILFVLVIAVLSVALISVVGLRLFGYQFRAVLSGSMEPELPVGAMLIIKSTPFEDIEIGDDITFVRDKKLTVVTHRVVAVDESNQQLTTKGLANNVNDAPVSYKNVIGTVRYSVPKLGYVVSYLTSTQGRIISITVIVAAVIIWLILGLLISRKEKQSVQKNGKKDECQGIKAAHKETGKESDKAIIKDCGVAQDKEKETRQVLGTWLDSFDSSSFDK